MQYAKKLVKLIPGTFISTGDGHWLKVLKDGTLQTSKYLGKEIADPATPIQTKVLLGIGIAGCTAVGMAAGGIYYMMNNKKYIDISNVRKHDN